MSREHRVITELSRDELDKLEAFARERRRPVKAIHEWLQAAGFTMSRSAARNWRRQFYAEDKVRTAAELSKQYMDVVKDASADKIADATLHRYQTMLFDLVLGANEKDAGVLLKIGRSIEASVKSGRQIEELRKEYQDRDRRALEAAKETAKEGGSGEAVVKRVREILGIKE